jgi:hypothetical protein
MMKRIALKMSNGWRRHYLADVIESVSAPSGPSATIKVITMLVDYLDFIRSLKS